MGFLALARAATERSSTHHLIIANVARFDGAAAAPAVATICAISGGKPPALLYSPARQLPSAVFALPLEVIQEITEGAFSILVVIFLSQSPHGGNHKGAG